MMLSEISQTQRQILYDVTSMWNVKSKLVNVTKKETDSQRKQTSGYQ